MSASCLKLCCTSSEISATAQGTRAVWAKLPGLDSPHQCGWHLLWLRNIPAGRAVLVGGLLCTHSPCDQGPACSVAFLSLWRGIFKDQLSSGASPPLCHSLRQFSGCKPELTHLHCACQLLSLAHLGLAAFRAWYNLGGLQYVKTELVYVTFSFLGLFALGTQGGGVAPSFLQDWYQNLHVW